MKTKKKIVMEDLNMRDIDADFKTFDTASII